MVSKRLKVTLIILCLSFCVVALGVHFYLPRLITEIKNPIICLITGKNYEANTAFDTTTGHYMNFTGYEGTTLSAFFTPSSLNHSKGTIILLHGIRATKEHFIPLSKQLSQLGYNTVALDSRAHGNSGGAHCTFGVKEKQDISKLIDLLIDKKTSTPIGVWGQSLGGAIGLQAMGYDQRIGFGIIESTFTHLKPITNDYFNFHTGFNIKPFTNYLLNRAGCIANFNVVDANPMQYCRKITQPIILVHGTKDKRIDIGYAKTNFKALASVKKSFIEIKDAHHLNVWKIGGKHYFEQIQQFLDEVTAN